MHPNTQILTLASERLGTLCHELVFLGGCATGLLITDSAAPEIRVTRDVDAIVQITTRMGYYQLGERLRACGFVESQEIGAPICRWESKDVILDVMPTNEQILGFSNPWYEPAVITALPVTLPSGQVINLVSAPYFLATKLAAFYGRGQSDFLMSHDIEDIIAVIDGRPEIVDDVVNADQQVRNFLNTEFQSLLKNRNFMEALPGHLPADFSSQSRNTLIIKRLQQLC